MNNSFYKLRQFIIEKGNILVIVNCGDSVFDHAVVPTITFTFSKIEQKNPIKILQVTDKKIEYNTNLNYKVLTENAKSGFNLLLSPVNENLLNKFKRFPVLSDSLEIRETIKTGNDHEFISEKKMKNSYPIITGKDIDQYFIKQSRYINYDTKKLNRPTKLSYYTQPKLFIRRVGSDICVAYDENYYLSTHVLYVGLQKSEQVHLKYLLALLNSKLINWIYNIKFPKKGNVFPEIRIGNLRTMPIIIASTEKQDVIIELVDKIMISKEKQLDTYKLETQIDKIIYKLYGLTKQEIAEIEKYYEQR